MVDICFGLKGDTVMKNINIFIGLLVSVLEYAEKEKSIICDGKTSQWSYDQIQSVILPEIKELLSYANKDVIYFKYGKKQRLLESSYLITDSLKNLSHTDLGKAILDLQCFYDTL